MVPTLTAPILARAARRVTAARPFAGRPMAPAIAIDRAAATSQVKHHFSDPEDRQSWQSRNSVPNACAPVAVRSSTTLARTRSSARNAARCSRCAPDLAPGRRRRGCGRGARAKPRPRRPRPPRRRRRIRVARGGRRRGSGQDKKKANAEDCRSDDDIEIDEDADDADVLPRGRGRGRRGRHRHHRRRRQGGGDLIGAEISGQCAPRPVCRKLATPMHRGPIRKGP